MQQNWELNSCKYIHITLDTYLELERKIATTYIRFAKHSNPRKKHLENLFRQKPKCANDVALFMQFHFKGTRTAENPKGDFACKQTFAVPCQYVCITQCYLKFEKVRFWKVVFFEPKHLRLCHNIAGKAFIITDRYKRFSSNVLHLSSNSLLHYFSIFEALCGMYLLYICMYVCMGKQY